MLVKQGQKIVDSLVLSSVDGQGQSYLLGQEALLVHTRAPVATKDRVRWGQYSLMGYYRHNYTGSKPAD